MNAILHLCFQNIGIDKLLFAITFSLNDSWPAVAEQLLEC